MRLQKSNRNSAAISPDCPKLGLKASAQEKTPFSLLFGSLLKIVLQQADF
jgi:hypothetical protein